MCKEIEHAIYPYKMTGGAIKTLATLTLVMTLLWTCESYTSANPSILEFQFNVCRTGSDDVLLSHLSYAQCVHNCDVRANCYSLNYFRRLSLCRLHLGWTNLVACDTPGMVYFQKTSTPEPTLPNCDQCLYQDECYVNATTNIMECVHKECMHPIQAGDTSAILQGNLLTVGSRVKVTCSPGSTLIGPSIRECNSGGQWNVPSGACYPDLTTTTGLPSFCPPYWYEYNAGCYLFLIGSAEKRTFNDAVNHCRNLDTSSNMLTIGGEAEFQFIRDHLDVLITSSRWDRVVWLGMIEDSSGAWTSVKNSNTVTWFNWASGEPNDFQGTLEECGALKNIKAESGWKYNDKDCSTTSEVVCEMRHVF